MSTMMEPLAPWLRDLNRYFGGGGAVGAFVPPADVLVTEQDVSVHMDVPGVARDRLEIELQNNILTVRGERPFPYEQAEGTRTWQRIERGFGRFERDLRVPAGLDPGKIEASLGDGVLSLRIPKPEPLKPHRIEIRSRQEGQQQPQIQGQPQAQDTAA
jgi:HSP20 family protein